ncbi:MAG: Rne/Rng family ribonuclease [Bacteroidales bacterium]|jgi:ribonuclease G|nr:Rne/Rng family ribonuclease [Bacteroidales bacterium]MCI2121790.1 Rne/Rng family ribonuclease [Bacteroidales bacterium]MCI2146021.1 Rne/Rng family ribonuclease [Bacteroidales bacterium]
MDNIEKDLVVNANPSEISIALMENHRLIEFSKEQSGGNNLSVGDVYLGRVKKIMPALNAAFVDIGDEKDAFVHYLDLGFNFKAFDYFTKQINPNVDAHILYKNIKINDILEKEGRIERFLRVGQPIVVQIVKEPISTKGARLTAEISIAGRNLVLLPFSDKISISQKITSKEERRRLERLVGSILPPNYGVILRTAAEGKKAAVLNAELRSLISRWEKSWPRLAKSKTVQLLFTETSRTTTILRDLLNDSFSNIYVNDEAVFKEIKDYVTTIAPEQEKIVKMYTGSEPIFDHFEVERQIKSAFGRVVPLKQGAYIIIEHTEALNVIDVNSGTRIKQNDQEHNSFDVNIYAADEIARQMRLRDLGGIVIVDFIDMEDNNHKIQLYKHMVELMENDRAKHNVLPLSRFGLMQITRQRVRPATEMTTTEVCPTCHGTGKIGSTLIIDETIERPLAYYCNDLKLNNFVLKVSPIIEAYLDKGVFNSIRRKWCKKYNCKIRIESVTDYPITQFDWYNSKGEKIEE